MALRAGWGRPLGEVDPGLVPRGRPPGHAAGSESGAQLDTASRFPLLLPEAVGTAGLGETLLREECERHPGTMNDVAIVKEGWLHKRGGCHRAGPGAGSRAGLWASLQVVGALAAWGAGSPSLLEGEGLPRAPGLAQGSVWAQCLPWCSGHSLVGPLGGGM